MLLFRASDAREILAAAHLSDNSRVVAADSFPGRPDGSAALSTCQRHDPGPRVADPDGILVGLDAALPCLGIEYPGGNGTFIEVN